MKSVHSLNWTWHCVNWSWKKNTKHQRIRNNTKMSLYCRLCKSYATVSSTTNYHFICLIEMQTINPTSTYIMVFHITTSDFNLLFGLVFILWSWLLVLIIDHNFTLIKCRVYTITYFYFTHTISGTHFSNKKADLRTRFCWDLFIR